MPIITSKKYNDKINIHPDERKPYCNYSCCNSLRRICGGQETRGQSIECTPLFEYICHINKLEYRPA
jgi:hypothetical protein